MDSTPVANATSNLLVQASGNLSVASSALHVTSLSHDALGVQGFVFPGGVVLLSGYTNGVVTNPSALLTLNTVVDNAYASRVVAGQGIFFQAPTIMTAAPAVTSGNAWVNFSTRPSTVPGIYGAVSASPLTPSFLTLQLDPTAYHVRPFVP
ncbi:hypothetical protein [Methylacidimicrobium cyclopophantes]|uniref:hypothetical protein n=1 Tax=Methylacidimicrobium cyclopophantes TaxID=1041766 RepID=UPI001157E713|nr:hypothetical protein [Methylacidimicrobium cyclopophantes]